MSVGNSVSLCVSTAPKRVGPFLSVSALCYNDEVVQIIIRWNTSGLLILGVWVSKQGQIRHNVSAVLHCVRRHMQTGYVAASKQTMSTNMRGGTMSALASCTRKIAMFFRMKQHLCCISCLWSLRPVSQMNTYVIPTSFSHIKAYTFTCKWCACASVFTHRSQAE
jgi:hypothetical protein